jgi:tRNA(Ile)-lysidine synthase
MALAWASAFALEKAGHRLEAVIIDHGLQDDSAEVAAATRERLAQMGIAASVIPVTVGEEGGIEHAARAARYDALEHAVNSAGAQAVLLGHTMDDQAETVLLGLARGSGPSSISGMATVSGLWWRPFLGLRRETTRSVCVDAGIEWWDDPHNDDDRFMRPRVRHRVLEVMEHELGPGIVEALARTAHLVGNDDAYLDSLANESLEPYATTLAEGHLPISALEGVPSPISSRMLRLALIRVGASAVHASHTDTVMALVADWHGQGPIDIPGVSVVREGNQLVFHPHTRS